MSFTVIIPARFASQRLPGKPLLDIAGKVMIERVYECAMQSRANRVVVATDNCKIFDFAQAFGAETIMTSTKHESGTDRLHETVSRLEFEGSDIVVNLQGDEPLMPPEVIDQVANNLRENARASAATVCERITDTETVFDSNAVKVVIDNKGYALYFSRASIPWSRETYARDAVSMSDIFPSFRHIGIYAYRVQLLHTFVTWPASPLERIEKLEQLRILSNGHAIHVAESAKPVPAGVDTAEDLQRVRQYFLETA